MTIALPGAGEENFGAVCPPQVVEESSGYVAVNGTSDANGAHTVGHHVEVFVEGAEEPSTLLSMVPVVTVEYGDEQRVVTREVPVGHARRVGRRILGALRMGVVVAETAFPINELLTYGPPVVVGMLTKDPVATGAAAGIATGALEMVAGRVGADMLGAAADAVSAEGKPITGREKGRIERAVDGLLDSRFFRKVIPQRGEKVDPITQGLVTLYGGTVAGQKLKEREDPSRTSAELRRFSDKAALALGVVCAAEAVGIEEGIVNFDQPYVSGPIAAGMLAGWLGLRKASKYIAHRNNPTLDTEVKQNDEEGGHVRIPTLLTAAEREASIARPNYALSPGEMDTLEAELVALVKRSYPEEGMVGVWIRPDSKYANFVRVHEARFFPEVQDVSDEDEDHTLFFALVDTRSLGNRIVHGATVTGVSYNDQDGSIRDGIGNEGAEAGFYTVDELIEQGNFTLGEFRDYYSDFVLEKCLAVETNFTIRRLGERTPSYMGLKGSDLAYLTFFKMLQKRAPGLNKAAVFATINDASIRSFERVGLTYEPLMGRTNLVTPEEMLGKASLPVVIPYNEVNRALFDLVDSLPEGLV